MPFLEEKMKGQGIYYFYHYYKKEHGSMGVREYGNEGKATDSCIS